MKESNIESKVAEIARAAGIHNLKLDVRRNTAWPDRIFFVPGGKPIIIEFKFPGESVRKKQEHQIDLLKKFGYAVFICDNVRDALDILRSAVSPPHGAEKNDKKRNRK